MDSEKDLLKKDLGKQEKPEEIQKFIEDAEMLGHEDIAELGRAKLQEISVKADAIQETSESQASQVENMGGSNDEIEKRTAGIDKQIEEVKIQTQEKITEVQNENKESQNVEAETEQKINDTKQETSENTVANSELQKELEQAKKNEEYWNQQKNKVQEKQDELVNYEHYKEFAKQKLDKVAEYQTKYQDLLDKEITTFPDTEKLFNERISFNDLSEHENKDLIYKRNIGELVVDVMQAYSSRYNKNPQRIFEAKKETTLRELLTEYKTFLENQLTIPKPTQTEINANQAEVNTAWDFYKKSQEEVKNIEKMTDFKNQKVKNETQDKIEKTENDTEYKKYQNLPEEIKNNLLKVEKILEHTEQQIDKMKQVIELYKNKSVSLSGVDRYNEAVVMVQNVADILGNGDYGIGLGYINGRDSENFADHFLITEKVTLELSNTSSETKWNKDEYVGGMNNLMGKKEYPTEVTTLMGKREKLAIEVQKLIREAVDIRNKERSQI